MADITNGTCYIGVVGAEQTPNEAWTSILNIARRPGDAVPRFYSGTKGYELRQRHLNEFMASGHDFILLLDHDMIFAPDTLERLRSHELPFVSGLYMRRQFAPIAPIWFQPFDGTWPMRPWTDIPERGRLHKIGASGWGCVFISRAVVEDTRVILRGELDIIEDDMDVWPYDIGSVFHALKAGDLDYLREHLRPLRGQQGTIIGSDIRYPFYALHAGYQLMGDPDVCPSHIVDYPLRPADYALSPEQFRQELAQRNAEAIEIQRREWQAAMEALQ